MNKMMRAALKALSYPDIDMKKNYRIVRQFVNITHSHILKPFGYKTWEHRIPNGDHDIPVRIFTPPHGEHAPILLFFHGGGWVTGNIGSYDKVCTNMARLTQHRVVSVDYRLAPEYRFPAGLEDCYRVALEIFRDNSLLGVDSKDITLIGDSAGANLAAAVSLMARDRGEFLPQRQILIYPATHFDHTESSPFESVRENGTDYLLTAKRICDYMDLYRSVDADLSNPYFAPLMASDLSNQPRTLLVTAQYDPLRDEGEAYGMKLRKAGNAVEMHRVRDALHGFFSLPPSFAPVRECYEWINEFLKEVSTDAAQVETVDET
ncbi:alpha/beta hydrolase [Candidatus Soleaferrea massiliensis]|uniref:alpha/beta hydrolase n=1 Tax=Candidatus Soleaferrea massiliensis TaxID=1470354 RepID=UPI003B96787F